MIESTETHDFNDLKNRFEPKDKKCKFCKLGSSNGRMSDNYFKGVYELHDRTNLIVFRNVRYDEVWIGIPRCRKCKLKHQFISLFSIFFLIAAIPLSLFLTIYFGYKFEFPVYGIVVTFFILILNLLWIFHNIDKMMHHLFSIKNTDEVALKYPLVEYFL